MTDKFGTTGISEFTAPTMIFGNLGIFKLRWLFCVPHDKPKRKTKWNPTYTRLREKTKDEKGEDIA